MQTRRQKHQRMNVKNCINIKYQRRYAYIIIFMQLHSDCVKMNILNIMLKMYLLGYVRNFVARDGHIFQASMY